MTVNDLVVSQLRQNQGIVQATLADFSDADMLVRPVPGANHVAWQLGHLVASEVMLANIAKPGVMPELPAGWAERYGKEAAKVDDASKFDKKQALLDQFARVREGTIKLVQGMTGEELARATPEKFRRFAATGGDLVIALVGHTLMHVGQWQVARRRLGKPVLF